MPEACGDNGAAGNAALDPAILEKAAAEKSSWSGGTGNECADAAAEALAEFAPADAEIGFLRAVEADEILGSFGLTQEVEGVDDLIRRHR